MGTEARHSSSGASLHCSALAAGTGRSRQMVWDLSCVLAISHLTSCACTLPCKHGGSQVSGTAIHAQGSRWLQHTKVLLSRMHSLSCLAAAGKGTDTASVITLLNTLTRCGMYKVDMA